MKKHIIISLLAALFVLTQIQAYSFNKSVQVLVKGKLVDEYTGNPVEAQLEFRDQNGKKIRTKSNSLDGSWEQIFNSGDKLDVVISHWNVARKVEKLVVKDTGAYAEQKQDYYVRKFEEGRPIFRFNLFEPQSAKLVGNFNVLVDSLKDILLFARNIEVELRVNIHDSYWKTRTVIPAEKPVQTKKKKNKKEPQVQPEPKVIISNPDAESVRKLIDLRVTELEAYIKDWTRFNDRIKVKGDSSTFEFEPDRNPDLNFDYEVIVTVLKNTLDK